MKVVINGCYGGFGLSHAAKMKYAELSGFKLYHIVEVGKRFSSQKFRYAKESDGTDDTFGHYYVKEPLNEDGSYVEKSWFYDGDIERNDKHLVEVVELLKEKANGSYAKLHIVEIPDDVDYFLDEYDGVESVHEKHRSWS
jgi:hypothetical protein